MIEHGKNGTVTPCRRSPAVDKPPAPTIVTLRIGHGSCLGPGWSWASGTKARTYGRQMKGNEGNDRYDIRIYVYINMCVLATTLVMTDWPWTEFTALPHRPSQQHENTCAYMHACMHVCTYVCMYACMYACIQNECMCVSMYICMHACSMHACVDGWMDGSIDR